MKLSRRRSRRKDTLREIILQLRKWAIAGASKDDWVNRTGHKTFSIRDLAREVGCKWETARKYLQVLEFFSEVDLKIEQCHGKKLHTVFRKATLARILSEPEETPLMVISFNKEAGEVILRWRTEKGSLTKLKKDAHVWELFIKDKGTERNLNNIGLLRA